MLTGHDCVTNDNLQMAIAIAESCKGTKNFSVSLLQRKFKKGYIWAAKLMEELEAREIVSEMRIGDDGNGFREVLTHEPFTIGITDEIGTHTLQSNRDCVWICRGCKAEKSVTKRDLDSENQLKLPICNGCETEMKFSYWLDCMD